MNELPQAKIAQIHRGYDALFRKLMQDMASDINKVLDEEHVAAIKLQPVAKFDCTGVSSRGRVIEAVFLTHAEIQFEIHYAGTDN